MSTITIDVTTGAVANSPIDAPVMDQPPTPQEVEAEVQALADQLVNADERMMALALATVDLKMVDTTGMTKAQVRQQFKDRVVFYLRERRGI